MVSLLHGAARAVAARMENESGAILCAPTKTPVSISTVNLSGFSGASAAKERSGLVLGPFPVRRDAGKERVTRRPSGSVGMQRGRVSAFPPATCYPRARGRPRRFPTCRHIPVVRRDRGSSKVIAGVGRESPCPAASPLRTPGVGFPLHQPFCPVGSRLYSSGTGNTHSPHV